MTENIRRYSSAIRGKIDSVDRYLSSNNSKTISYRDSEYIGKILNSINIDLQNITDRIYQQSDGKDDWYNLMKKEDAEKILVVDPLYEQFYSVREKYYSYTVV